MRIGDRGSREQRHRAAIVQAMLAVVWRCMLILAFTGSSIAASANELPLKFDPKRDAAKDVATALQLAKAEGKRVVVYVGGEWCGWCHIMDRFFAAEPEVRILRDGHYVWVKVNWSKENPNEAVLSRWPKIVGYPHLFVLDADGKLLHSQFTSLLEEGKGYDKRKFVAFLATWAPSARSPAPR